MIAVGRCVSQAGQSFSEPPRCSPGAEGAFFALGTGETEWNQCVMSAVQKIVFEPQNIDQGMMNVECGLRKLSESHHSLFFLSCLLSLFELVF